MKQPKRDRLDALDSELIKETEETRGWQLIRRRLLEVHAKKLGELVQPQTEIETATTRGFISGVALALKVPAILIAEGKLMGEGKDPK